MPRSPYGEYGPNPNNRENIQQNNPIYKAGFRNGDYVVYRGGEGVEVIAQVSIAGPTEERKLGGAWLLDENGRRLVNMPSESPEKFSYYKFPSRERAVEAYINSIPFVNSRAELLTLVFSLDRSGLKPNDPEFKIGNSWDNIVQMINEAKKKHNQGYALDKACDVFTRSYGLRDAVMRIISSEKNAGSKFLAFEKMEVGDVVSIKEKKYVKISKDIFSEQIFNASHTQVFKQLSFVEVQRMVLDAEDKDVKFEHVVNFNKRAEQENVEVAESFKALLPELYKTRFGVMNQIQDMVGKFVGKKRPETYEDVLDYLPSSEIQQGGTGDCYLLAAINSLKKTHPELYLRTLSKSIKRGERPGDWKVRFQGMNLEAMQYSLGENFDGWITITKKDLSSWGFRSMNSDLPDVILERAYASYVSRRNFGNAGKTMQKNTKSLLPFEGGFGHRALMDILGPEIGAKKMIADYEREEGKMNLVENGKENDARTFLTQALAKNPERYIVTANTPYKGRLAVIQYLKGKLFYNRHAYSVVGVYRDQVYLENPHDTSKQIVISVDDFVMVFSQISYVELK